MVLCVDYPHGRCGRLVLSRIRQYSSIPPISCASAASGIRTERCLRISSADFLHIELFCPAAIGTIPDGRLHMDDPANIDTQGRAQHRCRSEEHTSELQSHSFI